MHVCLPTSAARTRLARRLQLPEAFEWVPYSKLEAFYTGPERKFGLRCSKQIKEGAFVGEVEGGAEAGQAGAPHGLQAVDHVAGLDPALAQVLADDEHLDALAGEAGDVVPELRGVGLGLAAAKIDSPLADQKYEAKRERLQQFCNLQSTVL